MKEIRISALALKNFVKGLAELGYVDPKWTYFDPEDSYCDVKTSSGREITEEELEDLDDAEIVVLDGYIRLEPQVTCLSLQNTYRRWSKGLLPALQKPSRQNALAIDRLVAGLVLLKSHHPDLVPESDSIDGKILLVRNARLSSLRDADRLRLIELGWCAHDESTWAF